MQKLSINELLDSVGINQAILAKLMQVSRSTITRMKDQATPEVIAVIDQYKLSMTSEQSESVPVATAKPVKQPVSDIPVIPVTHRNIALSRIDYGAGIPIDTIAQSFGLSVFDYNQAVSDTVAHCNQAGTSFIQLRQ